MNVGVQNYFYKLKELSTGEIQFLKNYIDSQKDQLPETRGYGHEILESFNLVFELNECGQSGAEGPDLDLIICNLEEDLYCRYEEEGIRFFDKLYAKDVSFYKDDEEAISFIFFMCQQYFRTAKQSSSVKEGLGSFKGYNIDAMWQVLRHVVAFNFAYRLYQDKEQFRPVLIENTSTTPFITGDQPIITPSVKQDTGDILEHGFYYPLTPLLALLFTADKKHPDKIIEICQSETVIDFNMCIYEQSSEQVYASQKEPLELLLKV